MTLEDVEFQADETDKRKQRIVLTDYCREFCDKNDEMSKSIMERMFDGISGNDLSATIRTIVKIEKNLRRFGK